MIDFSVVGHLAACHIKKILDAFLVSKRTQMLRNVIRRGLLVRPYRPLLPLWHATATPRSAATMATTRPTAAPADTADAAPSLIVISRTVAPEDRTAFDAWHGRGQEQIDAVLGGPGRAHTWHFPAASDPAAPDDGGDGGSDADTIVVLFQQQAERDKWWHSEERRAWRKAGENLSAATAVQVDLGDAGMGGWLPPQPRTGREASLALPPPPPPNWVVATNVLLAIYPTISVLGLYAFPAIYAAAPPLAALPLAVKMFAQAACTVGIMTWGMIPLVMKLTGSLGFLNPETRNFASIASVAGVAGGVVAAEHFALLPVIMAGA